MSVATKIPVVLLTGFLGSGKTTFLNRILKLADFKNSLVIVNEFGSVPVDHLLVEESAETIYELSNGCLCCNMRGELVETLAGLDLNRFDRIFIETTGIADPLPVFQTLAHNSDMASLLQPSMILSIFDLIRGADLLKEHAEARHQIAVADQILLTKDDLVEASDAAIETVRQVNQNAKIGLASEITSLSDLSSSGGQKPETHSQGHSNAYRSAIMRSARRLSAQDLIGMLHMMVNQFGPNLLRIKGFAHIEDREDPVIVQVSGQIVHDLAPVSGTQSKAIGKTELVVITKNLDPAMVVAMFDGFFGNVVPDTADKDAMLNNPLSIPGF